jgi:hypothetical protein
MSSTGAEPGDAADQAYFLAIERAFLALRGQATLLAAEDWQTARLWRRAGIPVEFVVAVMESLFARQRERKSKRGISSLRYFRAAVAAAWDEQLAHRAGGGAPPPDPGPPAETRLARLAAAIPAELPGAGALRAAIAGLSGPLDIIETELGELEGRFLAEYAAGLPAAELATLAQRVERALGAAAVGVPDSARSAVCASLERQMLRRSSGLPVLSLFSPAAIGEPDANGS